MLPSPFFFFLPPTHPVFLSSYYLSLSHHFICTVQLPRRLNGDSGFLHLAALTYVLWHTLNHFYVVIDFFSPPLITLLLKSTQTILPFAPWFFPPSCHGVTLRACATRNEKTINGAANVCKYISERGCDEAPNKKNTQKSWPGGGRLNLAVPQIKPSLACRDSNTHFNVSGASTLHLNKH